MKVTYKKGGKNRTLSETGFGRLVRRGRNKKATKLERKGENLSEKGQQNIKDAEQKKALAEKRAKKSESARTDLGTAVRRSIADRTAKRARALENKGLDQVAKGERKSEKSRRISKRLRNRDVRRSSRSARRDARRG
tara:strand:- start:34 stop:444 length:411 start_codon:yes stop_codon:yes gene_type:complete